MNPISQSRKALHVQYTNRVSSKQTERIMIELYKEISISKRANTNKMINKEKHDNNKRPKDFSIL